MKKEKERGFTLVYKNIYFKDKLDYDLYEIKGLGRTVIISETLRDALQMAKRTGFEVNEYNPLYEIT